MPLSTSQCTTLACVWEATAPKAGNVHRGADFEDVTFPDFLASAVAIAPWMEAAPERPLGKTILGAVTATREVVETNTNLGIVLLLAPLAAVPRTTPLGPGVRQGIEAVLAALTPQDAADVYEAIRRAQPGGLGKVAAGDVAESPPADLVAAMRLAAERDLIARQYASGFAEVLERVVPVLGDEVSWGKSLGEAIVKGQLRLLAEFPDSLIARKCGAAVAREASDRAAAALAAADSGPAAYRQAVDDLDFWLRCDGHRRNPGTTADLVTAGLFVLLREGRVPPPFRFQRRWDELD